MSCLPGSHASEVKVSAGGTDRKGTEREPGLLPVSLWRLVCLPSGWTRPRSAGAGGHPGKRPDALCRKRVLQPHFTCRNGILITLGQSRGHVAERGNAETGGLRREELCPLPFIFQCCFRFLLFLLMLFYILMPAPFFFIFPHITAGIKPVKNKEQ